MKDGAGTKGKGGTVIMTSRATRSAGISVVSYVLPLAVLLAAVPAQAQTEPPEPSPAAAPAQAAQAPQAPQPGQAKTDVPSSAPEEAVPEDPTGGAYTSPTLLFVPAAAVPKWNARLIVSTELQGPSDVHAGFRPGLGAELGLPGGFTVGAGTNWVGGDVNATTNKTDFNLGLSPYFQARFHILGSADGMGWQLGTSVTYKFVGFEGDPGEAELGLSLQHRHRRYELGLQGAIGQDFGDSRNHDGEIHAYALVRVIPQLGLGAAGQVRIAIAPPADSTGSSYDAVGGAIASLTISRYQVGALGGASTIGLAQGQAGALGQLFASARF
jgi:hypothetical protein